MQEVCSTDRQIPASKCQKQSSHSSTIITQLAFRFQKNLLTENQKNEEEEEEKRKKMQQQLAKEERRVTKRKNRKKEKSKISVYIINQNE